MIGWPASAVLSDDHPRRSLRQTESCRDVQAPIEYRLEAW